MPAIGQFKLRAGKAELLKRITLKGPKSLGGANDSGSPPHDTSEQIDNLDQYPIHVVRVRVLFGRAGVDGWLSIDDVYAGSSSVDTRRTTVCRHAIFATVREHPSRSDEET